MEKSIQREQLVRAVVVRARRIKSAPTFELMDELVYRERPGEFEAFYVRLSDRSAMLVLKDAVKQYHRGY